MPKKKPFFTFGHRFKRILILGRLVPQVKGLVPHECPYRALD